MSFTAVYTSTQTPLLAHVCNECVVAYGFIFHIRNSRLPAVFHAVTYCVCICIYNSIKRRFMNCKPMETISKLLVGIAVNHIGFLNNAITGALARAAHRRPTMQHELYSEKIFPFNFSLRSTEVHGRRNKLG